MLACTCRVRAITTPHKLVMVAHTQITDEWVVGGLWCVCVVCVCARARTHARTLVHDSAIEDRRQKLQQEARFAANRVFR